MPELPEVETTRRGIAPYIENQTIAQIVIRNHQLRWPVPDHLNTTLAQRIIHSVSRRGKYLLLATDVGTLIAHLGMSGSLRILQQEQAPQKHDHLDFIFTNGICLRYHDPRRFGAMVWTTEPPFQHRLLIKLGPEPLSPDFNGDYLHQRAQNRSVLVKSFIMDSHIVVGVGNIYANEALFLAGIHPERPAGSITLERYIKLAEAIKTVLEQAITQGGTTLRNFVNEAGNPGYFKQRLNVYGRGKLLCRHCHSALTEIRISNRTTVFCPCCQQ